MERETNPHDRHADLPRPAARVHGDDTATERYATGGEALAAHHVAVHRPKANRDRGMAILLALVAVSLALLIGLALASNRDANTSAGGGVAMSTQSRTASAGALDIAEFISVRHSQSMAGNPAERNRTVFAPKQIGRSTLTATVRDASTLMAPTTESAGVTLDAAATVGGITTPVNLVRRVEWGNIDSRADLDLSEFAMLTTSGGIDVGANCEVSIWRDAPLAELEEPLVIGNALRDRSRVVIDPRARMLGHAILTPGRFPATEEAADEMLANQEAWMPVNIVVPSSPFQNTPATARVVDFNQLAAQVNTRNPNGGLDHFRVLAGTMLVGRARVPIMPPRTLVVNGPMPSGTWRLIVIDNHTELNRCDWTFNERTMLVARGNLIIRDSQIKVGPLGALAIVANGEVRVERSTIGPDDGNAGNSWNPNGTANYRTFGSSRVIIYGQRPAVSIRNGSVLKGQVYAPLAPLTVTGGSAVYGRLLGASIALADRSNLFYDPELNAGTGWLNPRSGIWWRTNEVRPETAGVRTLWDADLSNFSRTTLVAVDEPETSMLVTQNVAAAGGFGVSTLNEADSGSEARTDVAARGTVAGAAVQYPDLYLVISGTLRDFREATEIGGHPDFGNDRLQPGTRWGLVEPRLSKEGRPVLARTSAPSVQAWFSDRSNNLIAPNLFDATRGDRRGAVHRNSQQAITDAVSFSSWFTDSPGVNLSEPYRIVMRRFFDQNRRSTYIFDSNWADPFFHDGTGPKLDGFFPLESRLFGNSALKAVRSRHAVIERDRNFHFTLELEMEFTYEANANQAFTIQGNDDIWAFIDGKLVIDIGGMHHSVPQTVHLDRLGLSDGQTSKLKVFYANRTRPHSHFRLATNFPVADPLPPQPPQGPTQFLRQLADRRVLNLQQFAARR
jgi:fibro-slime domain-containing protein